ncbi:Cystatin domain-containing protein [Heracleum sosnowskyi]|uniref:Cystatin domain-containing protein n=1 Tax=Heracleum sosnowskyi TaxID=360622 RepID=A0AAD8I9S1_9APIA|nr:Cystatin domain-containing protein [Heracleum sosnowskyi]
MEGSSKHKHNDEIPSREQRLEWFMSTNVNRKEIEKHDKSDSADGTHAMTFRDMASLQLDLYESGGFDVQDYSKVNDAGMIHTYYDPAAGITVRKDYLDEIMDCARLAILQYNTEKGTHFDVDHVIKTNVEPVCPYRQPPCLFSLEDVVEDMTDLTIAPRCVRCG